MKTPRNVSGPEPLKALRVLGYERIRQAYPEAAAEEKAMTEKRIAAGTT